MPLKKKLNVEVDKSGKDIPRACHISHDPDMYINENFLQFKITIMQEIGEFQNNSMSADIDKDFQYVVNFTDKIDLYFHGNRHNYLYLLANNCNRAGIEKQNAESLIMSHYNDSDMKNDIPNAIKSAYSHTSEHGIWSINYIYTASSAQSAFTAKNTNQQTPIIPGEIHNQLPDFLKMGVDAMELDREKDVFLTGAITILSGCFPNVKGLYDRKELYTNLNGFIIAPPASGKGNLIYAKELGSNIHLDVITKYNLNNTFEKDDQKDMPRTLFIPANSSSAAVMRSLKSNQGIGIICETEADTLSTTFKQDWGGYSDIIRKAFHHEPISFGRVGENESIILEEIECPKISVCLSGTPNQVSGLISGIEDGLFSRFLFYNYKNEGVPYFKDVFKQEGIQNLTEFFKQKSEIVFQTYRKFKESQHIVFRLKSDHKMQFVPHFDKLLKRIINDFGNETDLQSIVYRLGVLTFRVAMILTILRNFNKPDISDILECNDVDFQISVQLSEIYLEHALSVYQSFPKTIKINHNIKVLYEFLPDRFKTSEAVTIGKTIMSIHERTVANYLQELKLLGWLKQPKTNGEYLKSRLQ